MLFLIYPNPVRVLRQQVVTSHRITLQEDHLNEVICLEQVEVPPLFTIVLNNPIHYTINLPHKNLLEL